MSKYSTEIFGRKFVYLTVLLFFVGGMALGWANGETRVRQANSDGELNYYKGVYSLCMAWLLNLVYVPTPEAITQCGINVQDGYDMGVWLNPDYSQGFHDPRIK